MLKDNKGYSHEQTGQPKSISAALALQKAKDREAEYKAPLWIDTEVEYGREYWWQREPKRFDAWMARKIS